MSLAFHWFLPTYGDSRNLVAGGHGTAMHGDRPATLRYLRQICAAAEDQRFRGGAHAHRIVVRGRLVDDGDADRGHRDTEIPGRLPARAAQPHPGRADGRDLPAALGRTAAAQCRHRRRTARAAGLRGFPGQGVALRAHRRVPARGAATVDLAGAGDLRRRPHSRRGRAAEQPARPDTRGVLRRIVGGRRAGRGQVLRRLPHLG